MFEEPVTLENRCGAMAVFMASTVIKNAPFSRLLRGYVRTEHPVLTSSRVEKLLCLGVTSLSIRGLKWHTGLDSCVVRLLRYRISS